MKQEIDLTLQKFIGSPWQYTMEDLNFLCYGGLNDYFYLHDTPEQITIVLSTRKTKNSYFVECVDEGCIRILKSNGRRSYLGLWFRTFKELKRFGGKAWVSVIA